VLPAPGWLLLITKHSYNKAVKSGFSRKSGGTRPVYANFAHAQNWTTLTAKVESPLKISYNAWRKSSGEYPK
jgi:hypothetical protein